jgi:hypothetical protein
MMLSGNSQAHDVDEFERQFDLDALNMLNAK